MDSGAGMYVCVLSGYGHPILENLHMKLFVLTAVLLGHFFVIGGCNSEETKAIRQVESEKYLKWVSGGVFKGFNITYYNDDVGKKSLQDFLDIKALGANVVQIQTSDGYRRPTPPYDLDPLAMMAYIDMVDWSRQAGLSYIIAVRAGPGRYSVEYEADDIIWTDDDAQNQYAKMLTEIVSMYKDDPLFVGINVMVEPNPLHRAITSGQINTPQELERALKEAGIAPNALMTKFIQAVRSVSADLPVIVQGVKWSDAQWWDLVEKQSDPYVIYDVHSYTPYDYSHALPGSGLTYPGVYYPDLPGSEVVYDKSYLSSVVFEKVKAFQRKHNVPVMLGEFGLAHEQVGGVQYLSDMQEIAVENGWHYNLWAFRPRANPEIKDFNYEYWNSEYWEEISGWFGEPPKRISIPSL